MSQQQARPGSGYTAQVAIAADDVAVRIRGRLLIRNVSLVVQPGEVIGIMGPSGAGKSTLLAALTGYQRPTVGRVLVSGLDFYENLEQVRGQIGYVPQDDIMHADLTVWQALWYSGRLRLPRDYSDERVRRRIIAVIDKLGLGDVVNTRIGSAQRRGISGGQRKRVNVAMELITNPPVLVLDEPTSGLASTDALALVRLLRRLADTGKAVVLTIHQPGVDVMKLMNGLAVVARDRSTDQVGIVPWYGPAFPDAAEFFEPSHSSPDAEAVMRGLESRSVSAWRAAYEASPVYEEWCLARRSLPCMPSVAGRQGSTLWSDWVVQWSVLLQRAVTVKMADVWGTAILVAQAPLIACLVVMVFGSRTTRAVDPDNWSDVAQAVTTATFLMVLAAAWLGCSSTVREIVGERAILNRERMVGVGLGPYVASKIVLLFGFSFIQCFLLLIGIGDGCGFGAHYWVIMVTLVLAANVSGMIGLCVSALVESVEAAAGVLPLIILPMVVLGGILLPLKDLAGPARILADATPTRWAFEKVLVEEARSRPVLQMAEGGQPGSSERMDMAEPAFPMSAGRSGDRDPLIVLGAMWIETVVVLTAIVLLRERRRGR